MGFFENLFHIPFHFGVAADEILQHAEVGLLGADSGFRFCPSGRELSVLECCWLADVLPKPVIAISMILFLALSAAPDCPNIGMNIFRFLDMSILVVAPSITPHKNDEVFTFITSLYGKIMTSVRGKFPPHTT